MVRDTVLVVDAGGRGNAIAHAFARSPHVEKVYVTPGNAGSEFFKKCEIGTAEGKPIASIRAIDDIVKFAKNNRVNLSIVCPEEPLEKYLVNKLEEEGIPTVGPVGETVWLESSKFRTKDFLR